MRNSGFDEMTGHEGNVTVPSRSVRRMVVLGFYLSFPLWCWFGYDSTHGGAPPEGFGWYVAAVPWLAFGFFALFVFCSVKLFRSNVGFPFSGPRDERQQAALMRTYSLSYTLLGAIILIPGGIFSVLPTFFGERFIPSSNNWIVIVAVLLLVTATLPRAVAMWLEPDPPRET